MSKLITCKACGEHVSKQAPACPKCGQPIKPRPSGCGTVLLLGCLAIFAAIVVNNINNTVTHPGSEYVNIPPGTEVPVFTVPGHQWSYRHSDDDMSNGIVSTATVSSENTVNFAFPYNGEQHGTLTLRTHPRHGKDLYFRVQKGQILCHSRDDCSVLVRFDDGEAMTFKAAEPSDNSTEYIFIRDYHGFVGKMLKAERVRISVKFYQQGAPVFDFDVRDFSQSKYLPEM